MFLSKVNENRHIIYSKEDCPNVNRRLHTFIVVTIKNKKDEEKKERSVLEKLDTLIKDKIMKKGECKAIRSENNPASKQTTLRVRPNTYKNSEQTTISIDDYYNCPIQVEELGKNIYIANFNVQDKNEPCMYSDKGQFTVGAGIMTNVDTKDNRLVSGESLGGITDTKRFRV